jgi:hypothetical protein
MCRFATRVFRSGREELFGLAKSSITSVWEVIHILVDLCVDERLWASLSGRHEVDIYGSADCIETLTSALTIERDTVGPFPLPMTASLSRVVASRSVHCQFPETVQYSVSG